VVITVTHGRAAVYGLFQAVVVLPTVCPCPVASKIPVIIVRIGRASYRCSGVGICLASPLIQIRPYSGHVHNIPYGIIRVSMIEVLAVGGVGGHGG